MPPTTAPLTFGSVFAGIGGADHGFERAGLAPLWNCEIDAHCRKVLAKHWPGVPRFKDVRTVTGAALRDHGLVPDILVGGFPCQDISVAGRRAGLESGERSGLFYEFARIAEEAQSEWLVIENVPGLLSSGGRRDMGSVLGILADIGYMGAWRVLDAQYFGVAQRRRRVFIVGHLGDGRRAAELLLEPEGVRRDPPARRPAGSGPAGSAGGCVAGDGDLVTGLTGSFANGGADDNKAQAGWLVPAIPPEVTGTLRGGSGNRGWCDDLDRATFIPHHINGAVPDLSNALCSNRGRRNDHNEQTFLPVSHPQRDLAVRRLMPIECLRLQGFPDSWLDGLGLSDSTKYRMVGNAIATPVAQWIGRRLIAVTTKATA